MEWVIVRFPRSRDVYIDGRLVGATNEILTTVAGPQTFDLGPGGDYRPPERLVTVSDTAPDAPQVVRFQQT
jgi:hypothetical protein